MSSESAFWPNWDTTGETIDDHVSLWDDDLIADLNAIVAHIIYVANHASERLDGPENHELYLAYRKTQELIASIRQGGKQ